MPIAKIEIASKPLSPLYDHIFIIYTVTDDVGNSTEYYFRGGPSVNNDSLGVAIPEISSGGSGNVISDPFSSIGRPFGDVLTMQGLYVPGTPDWYPNAARVTIKEGSQAELEPYFLAIDQQMEAIDNAGYRYNPANSNSNTTIFTVLQNVGLNPVLPMRNNEEVWAPGYDSNFKTPLEEMGDLIMHYGSELGDWFSDTASDIFDTSSDASRKLIDVLNPIGTAYAGEFGNETLINDAVNNTLNYYSNTAFSKAWESFGISTDLGSGSATDAWSSLGTSNSFLDNYTFGSGGSNYTLFGQNDRITLPSLGIEFNQPSTINGLGTFNMSADLGGSLSRWVNATNRISPLVLDLDGDGIETTGLYDTSVFFDIDADGFAEKVGWVEPSEGLLAIDTNDNGIIDDITELFGDDQQPAFDKLRKFDTNHDGKISAGDEGYDSGALKIWRDLDTDGFTDVGELQTLLEAGVKEISLAETTQDIYQNDNYISSNARFTRLDNSTGEIADVHFMNDNVNTWFMGAQSQVYGSTYEVDPEALLLPLSRGYGSLASLHIAMTNDTTLKSLMKELVNLDPEDFSQLSNKINAFMFQWAGVTDNDPNARSTGDGNNIDSRMVDFIEEFTGVKWAQMGTSSLVGEKAALIVKQVWGQIAAMVTERILVQGTLSEIFPDARYDFKTDSISLGGDIATIVTAATSYVVSNGINADVAHDFWLDIGNILIAHKGEFGVSVEDISTALDTASGENLHISEVIITQADGDIYSVKADADGNYQPEHLETSVYKGGAGDDLIIGSNHNDYIFGQGGNDTLHGKAGDDFLRGDASNDTIYGDDGDDRLEGSGGNDYLEGGAGRDDIHGGSGDDTLLGGAGDDRLEGDAGADIIDGGAGINTIAYLDSPTGVYVNLATNFAVGGYADGDVWQNIQNIDASDHDDFLVGDAESNSINGESGDDIIHGGAGNDYIFGGSGDDFLYGEEGDDSFEGYNGAEYMDGGSGIDSVNYENPYINGGVYLNLETGKGYKGAAAGDTYVNIEDAAGTKYDDILIGDAGNNNLFGLKGNDVLKGGDGDDILIGGGGYDSLEGGKGSDQFIISDNAISITEILDFTPGVDTLNYRELGVLPGTFSVKQYGSDIIIDVAGKYIVILKNLTLAEIHNTSILVDSQNPITTPIFVTELEPDNLLNGDEFDNKLQGGIYNDIIHGNSGSDVLLGLWGDDSLSGDAGDDILQGGSGSDNMDGGSGIDLADYLNSYTGVNVNLTTGIGIGGEAEGDMLVNIENLSGSNFADILIGDSGANLLQGEAGDDILNGKTGNDFLAGGEGSDIFVIDVDIGSTKVITDFEITNPNEKIDLTSFSNITSIDIISTIGTQDTTIVINKNQSIVLVGVNWGYADILESGQKFMLPSGSNPDMRTEIQPSNMSNVRLGTSGNDTFSGTGTAPEIFIDGKGSDTIYLNSQDTFIDLLHVSKQSGDVDTIYNYRSETGLKVTTYTHYTYVGYYTLPTTYYSNVSDKRVDLSEFANFRNLNDVLAHTSVSGGDTHIDLGNGQKLVLKNYQNGTSTSTNVTLTDLNNQQAIAATGLNFSAPADWTWTPKETVTFNYNFLANNFIFYSGTMTGTLADDIMDGGYGVDNINSYDGNDTINTYAGDDIINSGNGNDMIAAGDGNDIVSAGADADTIYGGSGNDAINAGSGNDTIYDGVGNDNMTGGAGSDKFVITKELGATDTINDFEYWNPNEKIDLTAFNSQFTNFVNLKDYITQNGNNTEINLGGNQKLVLDNVKNDYLSKDNFIGNASINTAPVANIIDNQEASKDHLFSFKIPTDSFTDPDGDYLTYSATLSDGSPLPLWLTFDTATKTFSGTPDNTNLGIISIKIIADDSATGITELLFNLEVVDSNSAPVAIGDISDATIAQGQSGVILTASLVQAAFADSNSGDYLTYSLDIYGQEIPEWLSINHSTGEITSTHPGNSDVGTYDIAIIATDSSGESVAQNFSVSVSNVNDAPNAIALHNHPVDENSDGATIGTLTISDADIGDTHTITIDDNRLEVFTDEFGVSTVKLKDATHLDYETENTITVNITATDSGGLALTEEFTIAVNNTNDMPTVDTIIANQNGISGNKVIFTIPANSFTDIDGDALTYTAQQRVNNSDGTYFLTPLPTWLIFDAEVCRFSGIAPSGVARNIEIVVTASDGLLAASQKFDLHLDSNAINGTSGNDSITGDSGHNYLAGGAGNDTLIGGAGADYIDGGAGDDYVKYNDSGAAISINLATGEHHGGDAEGDTLVNIERIMGSNYDDVMIGSAGNDTLYGGSGNDHIEGGAGNDTFNGNNGADYIDGGEGIDSVWYNDSYGAVNVNLATNENHGSSAEGDILLNIENLFGSNYDDILTGDIKSNTISGKAGKDTLYGGDGNDTLIGGDGEDILDGGAGWDTAYYNDSTTGITINLITNDNHGGTAEGDTLFNIERIWGSNHNDTLIGAAGWDNLVGGAGNDTLSGGDGNDTLIGGDGEDYLVGGDGADYIDGGAGNDYVKYNDSGAAISINLATGEHHGGAAEGDTLVNIERIMGSNYDDVMIGSAGNDTLYGGSGNDHIEGGAGNDTFNGNNGADYIDGGEGIDSVWYNDSYGAVNVNLATNENHGSSAEGDILIGIENLFGGNGMDNLTGDANNNYLSGGNNNDYLSGMSGNDQLYGGAGNDTLIGGAGADQLTGGAGSDSFNFNLLSDSNSTGFDTIADFVQGVDKIDLVALHTYGIESFADITVNQDIASNSTIITANDNSINFHSGSAGYHTDFEIHLNGIIDLQDIDFSWG